MNVAKNPARRLPRPLPLRPPSPAQYVHASQVMTRSSRPSPSRANLHGSQVTSHQSRLGKFFRIRSYRNPARNPFRIRSYKNTQGVASPLSINPALCPMCRRLPRPGRGGKNTSDLHNFGAPITTFRINTCISVASKGLYLPLESILMKKGGRGRGVQTQRFGLQPITGPMRSFAARATSARLAPASVPARE